MLKMYILIALRKLLKEKAYVFINVSSLALGIGSFLILALYLNSELSYDQHFSKHESIYRISSHFGDPAVRSADFAISSQALGPLLVQDYPQIGTYIRFRGSNQNVLSYQDKRFSWESIYMVDENVFEVFDHEILSGDPNTAFMDRNSIAISESFSQAYFGNEDPIGKVLTSDSYSYRVTLLFADLPENTHLKYQALYPYSILSAFNPNYQDNYFRGLFDVNTYTYLHVNPGFDLQSFDGIIAEFAEKYMAEGYSEGGGFRAVLTPLESVHFTGSLLVDRPTGNIFYLYAFSAVAIFILLVACINYINLATARASKRAKEIGMRKVLGASRNQLIGQFLGESIAFTSIALVIGLLAAIAALAFTPMGGLMGNRALLTGLVDPTMLLGMLLIGILVALVSGLYPAFYLSSIPPIAALTKQQNSWRNGLSIRQGLVLIQMMISIAVIICCLLMSQQLRFIAEKPLGFTKENQVWVQLRGADVIEQLPALRNELLVNINIIDVVQTSNVPGYGHFTTVFRTENNEGMDVDIQADWINVSSNYVDGMGIELTQGRTFSTEADAAASIAMLANEAMVRKMGWDNPIGKQVTLGGFEYGIVGVTSDFHYASMNSEIGPLLISPIRSNFTNLSAAARSLQNRSLIIRISGEAVGETLQYMEDTITKFGPNQLFDPGFLEALLDDLYRSEMNLLRLTEIFAAVCIFISALGLFGLASFNATQRTREIGIRKTLGASSQQIVVLLTKNLLLLVTLAAIPASMASYSIMSSWLDKFAYKAELDLLDKALPFAVAITIVTVLALVTVTVQSIKAAQSNPANILRSE